ncbi:alanine racemase [Leifsonia sp. YAF41]|uniref:alanine racemase n=1 Tax=Leifsonia sp. YAF41 TaxID=3233086 RepID=UPI003F9D786F
MTRFREAVIDLDAIAANIRHLSAVIGDPQILAVVKANAYGHGAVPVARMAVAAGASWLGVADVEEGLELRRAGITAPILAWLHGLDTDFAAAITADIDLGLSSVAQLSRVADAAMELGQSAAVQLKLETGLSRNGAAPGEWDELFTRAAALERAGRIRVRGIMSHLSNTSPADDAEAIARFDEGLAAARAAGLTPDLVHLAATAAALRVPESRYSMVRLGIGIYGLSPFEDADSGDLGLIPAMTVRGQIAAVRRVAAGAGVSYDYTWRAQEDSTLALVPLGYADGIPRQASGRGEVQIGARRYPIVGRIAMDQFVVNLGHDTAAVGDEVVLFGDPVAGVPSANDWADAALTVNYEIVTRIGHRVTRSYCGGAPAEADAQP